MLTANRLRSLLDYDPVTGIFRWSGKPRIGVTIGRITGNRNKVTGYLSIRVDGSLYYAHRLAWLYMTGEWPPAQIDHINMVRDDNRFANLRCATRQQNAVNRPHQRNSKTYLKGVYLARNGKFYSHLVIDGRLCHLGTFDTAEEAFAFRNAEAKRIYGEFYRSK